MGPKRKAGAAPPPAVLQGGVRFVHPSHGKCEVLPNGEWTFDVGKSCKEPHVYFRVLSSDIPMDIVSDANRWDTHAGIRHQHSAAVRAMIKSSRALPDLSTQYDATPELRQMTFKKHPMFHFIADWKDTAVAKQLKSKNVMMYAEAKRRVADIKFDQEREPIMAAVIMKSLVSLLGFVADEMRRKLAPTRPRQIEPGASRAEATTEDKAVTMDENQARYMEALLYMCGFQPSDEDDGGSWVAAVDGAVKELISTESHASGVNPMRRSWEFSPGDLHAWRGGGASARTQEDPDPHSMLMSDLHSASDKKVYAAAAAELGAAAYDDENRMLPAWMLRHEIETEWIKTKDPRLRAHAEVLPETVTIMLYNKTVSAPGTKRMVLGATLWVKFEWNGWVRKNSPGDVLEPMFKHHAARAIRRVQACQ